MKLELQLFGGRGGGSGLSGGGGGSASASVTSDWKTWTLGTEVTMTDRDVYAGEFGGGSRGQEFDGRVTDVADDHLIVTTYDENGNKLADNWVDNDTAGIFNLKQTTQKTFISGKDAMPAYNERINKAKSITELNNIIEEAANATNRAGDELFTNAQYEKLYAKALRKIQNYGG